MHLAQHPGHRGQAVALQANRLQIWQPCQTTRQASIRYPASYTSASVGNPALCVNQHVNDKTKSSTQECLAANTTHQVQSNKLFTGTLTTKHVTKAQKHNTTESCASCCSQVKGNKQSECDNARVVQGISRSALGQYGWCPCSTPASSANSASKLLELQLIPVYHMQHGRCGTPRATNKTQQ